MDADVIVSFLKVTQKEEERKRERKKLSLHTRK